MNTLTRASIKLIQKELQDALNVVGEKHNLKISLGGGSYNSNQFTTKMTVKTEGAKAVEETQGNSHAKMLGLPDNSIGKTFKTPRNGEQYKITGINLNRPKYPVSAVRVKDGRGFKFPSEQVVRLLKK